MITGIDYNIFDVDSPYFNLIFVLILIFLSVGVSLWFEIKNLLAMVLMFSIIIVFLYAVDILDFYYALLGITLSVISLYFVKGVNKDVNN